MKKILKIKYFCIIFYVIFSASISNIEAFQRLASDSLQVKKAEWQIDRAYKIGRKELTDSVEYYFENSKVTFKNHHKWEFYVKALLRQGILSFYIKI